MSIKQRLFRSVGRFMGDLGDLSEDDQRAVRGWCVYDWANSAFSTSITVAILPIYFAAIFTSEYHTGGPGFLGCIQLCELFAGLTHAVTLAIVITVAMDIQLQEIR